MRRKRAVPLIAALVLATWLVADRAGQARADQSKSDVAATSDSAAAFADAVTAETTAEGQCQVVRRMLWGAVADDEDAAYEQWMGVVPGWEDMR